MARNEEERGEQLRRRFQERLSRDSNEPIRYPPQNDEPRAERRQPTRRDDASEDTGYEAPRAERRPPRRDDDDYDEPQPARSSMMQERMRRTRNDDFYDDPYDGGGAYARSFGPVGPRYPSQPRGGGCAAGLLYTLLIGVALAIAIYFVGRDTLRQLIPTAPSIPSVREVMITPTPTIRDRGGTVIQIKALNRLETQQITVERVVEAKSERGNLLDTVLGERLLLVASGNVVAGVDLSRLTSNDVTISQDGESITIRLPPSEIFSKSLNNERTRVYDYQSGIGTRLLGSENKDLEAQARQAAEDEILSAACELNVTQKAADEAKKSMEQFLRLLDFTSVTVEAPAGQCVAPSSAPPLTQATPTQ